MADAGQRWPQALERFKAIDGMLGLLDASTITAILEWQAQSATKGHLAEFGTYKGRSASLLAHYVRDDEELYLVDVASYLQEEAIRQITQNYRFLKMDSKDFVSKIFRGTPPKSFRFVHSDGSHTFNNVYDDLRNAEALLAPSGIFVIDDYFNPHYPQVPAAVFTYLAREKTDLAVSLVGSNKCYICRKGFHKTFRNFARREFPELMETFGVPVRLSKTDRNPAFDCISFTGRPAGSDERVYGAQLYGHFLKD